MFSTELHNNNNKFILIKTLFDIRKNPITHFILKINNHDTTKNISKWRKCIRNLKVPNVVFLFTP